MSVICTFSVLKAAAASPLPSRAFCILFVSLRRLPCRVSVLTSTSSLAYSNSCSWSVLSPVWLLSVSRSSAVLVSSSVFLASAVVSPPTTVTAAAPLAENPASLSTALCTAGGRLMPSVPASPLITSARLRVSSLVLLISLLIDFNRFSCLATSVCAAIRLARHCIVVLLPSPSRWMEFS